ncbi:hypothetical protein F8M41_023694 [Gigaspora margarita]|uniref:Uncharacterized protein n=1 Tax=Gigaspora margarita TaxID=4874 RepID=A0A8H4AD07_GIGMA|nr:hypothetical protein F8M41_023694 [Gigaspora margarita]
MSNTHNALAAIYHIDNFEMSNTHNALATIYQNDHSDCGCTKLLYDIKISDIMSNLIDNELDYSNEIYNDQFISYTLSQSKNNNSEDESKNLIITFEEFISISKNIANNSN